MANFALVVNLFVLCSFASCVLAQNWAGFLGMGNLRQVRPEEQQVVEIIRWRQPVCLSAAPGVLPCMVGLQNFGPSAPGHHYSTGYPQQNRNVKVKDNTKASDDDDLLKKLTQDDSEAYSSSLESIEEADHPAKRSPRSATVPKLFSPMVVRSVQLENMGASSLRHPEERRGRYLRFVPSAAKTEARSRPVYVTRVVDSPVVATLVATTCLPDIGIPVCEEIRDSPAHGPAGYVQNQAVSNPGWTAAGQPPYPGYVTPNQPPNYSPNGTSNGQQTTQAPNVVQNVVDFINPPNIVQTNQTPEIKPVIVIQPTSPPNIFDGINAFLMPNGSWFGVFGGNATGAIQLPQLPQFPQLPQLPPLPQIPSLQQLMNRPENDISGSQNILNVFNMTSQPGVGPPTQSPGIFGGLFPSPARPAGVDVSTTTTTAAPSIFDSIGNIFRPTNRPLVVEAPNQRPIVIERPVYVAELPVVPGIFDSLQPQNRPVRLNSTEEPQIISDPVYVLQQPTLGGGFLPNLNIFGTSNNTQTTTTTSTTTNAPVINSQQNYYPTQQQATNSAPNYNVPVTAPVGQQQNYYPAQQHVTTSGPSYNVPQTAPISHHQNYYPTEQHVTNSAPSYNVPQTAPASHHQNYYPTEQHVTNSAPSYNAPVAAPSNPHLPSFPNPPNVAPGYGQADYAASAGPQIPQSYGYSKSTGIIASQNYGVSFATDETSPPDSASSVINLEESYTTQETDLEEENDLLAGSVTEIVNAGVETDEDGIAGEEYVVEDVLDTTLLSEDEAQQGTRKIEIKAEIDNEA